eukprot:CCRYP_000842-RA/>CCRYP_000842-RA protein AED:0.19 eAED:0.19 QI:210/1/1/1/0.75/0.6/5/1266/713
MSRRRGEFEHRTSIFEGAFRAWSHLGGLEPLDLETKAPSELDPLLYPIENDPRLSNQKDKDRRKSSKSEGDDPNADDLFNWDEPVPHDKNRREYPYEPLPRSGLAHPFVQAILSPWLGPDADQDAIQLGLTTLRTWWQHRRKGESGSAIVALGTEKMQGVVEGYTRHFFNLAHCLVVNDKEQPPRTLQSKMRELEKTKAKKGKKRSRDDDDNAKIAAIAYQGGFGGGMMAGGADAMPSLGAAITSMGNPAPSDVGAGLLDRLQASQRRLLAAEGGVSSLMPGAAVTEKSNPLGQLKATCIPGKVDLPGLVQQVNSAATQLAHRGMVALATPFQQIVDPSKYGDPNVMPVILISQSGDIQFLMSVDGITCAHCVKIVETVLKGCQGRSGGSPIDGLLDASADQQMNAILIKIEKIADARRIAHEAARNLSMVGYNANAKSINIQTIGGFKGQGGDEMTLQKMYAAFEIVPNVNPMLGTVLNWNLECQCPDNNITKEHCPRHFQMSHRIFDAFDRTERLVSEFVAGCGKKYGMSCTAGAHCFCKSGIADVQPNVPQLPSNNDQVPQSHTQPIQESAGADETHALRDAAGRSARMSMRMSLGGLIGRHSLTSNTTTFGRAMSGLSALSIDWENMDDFDINVDHSEGINNDIVNRQKEQENAGKLDHVQEGRDEGYEQMEMNHPVMKAGPRAERRSSLKNPNITMNANANMNVSFDM